MLDIRPAVDDEPAAPVAALAPAKPDKAAIDRRAINRKAVKHWEVIWNMVVDRAGRSTITHLNPSFVPTDPNVGRPYGVPDPRPQVKQLRGPMPWSTTTELGSWYDLGTGKRGDDCISLIEMLGMCSRDVATNYLRELVGRIVEIKP